MNERASFLLLFDGYSGKLKIAESEEKISFQDKETAYEKRGIIRAVEGIVRSGDTYKRIKAMGTVLGYGFDWH
jgi:predicted RNA-binding protein associated with RNAse of E/G family